MPAMSISDEHTAATQFVSSREVFSSTWIKGTKIWQIVYSVFFVAFVGYAVYAVAGSARGHKSPVPHNAGLIFFLSLVALSVVCGIVGLYLYRRSRQPYILSVSGDSLTVAARNEVYSLADAQLSLWVGIGVALHLQSGQRRFILGGQGRRIGPSTPLDVPPTQLVDARLPAPDFDELLRLGGRAAVRGPAPGEPTRCVLWPSSKAIGDANPLALAKKQRIYRSLSDPQVFVDVDGNTIRVLDPGIHALEGSAAISRATATPSIYETHDTESGQTTRIAVLTVCVPGMAPITVECPHPGPSGKRFAWSAGTPLTTNLANYVASAADWLTLVDTFALTPKLQDRAKTA